MTHRFKHRANARSRRGKRVRAGLAGDPSNRQRSRPVSHPCPFCARRFRAVWQVGIHVSAGTCGEVAA